MIIYCVLQGADIFGILHADIKHQSWKTNATYKWNDGFNTVVLYLTIFLKNRNILIINISQTVNLFISCSLVIFVQILNYLGILCAMLSVCLKKKFVDLFFDCKLKYPWLQPSIFSIFELYVLTNKITCIAYNRSWQFVKKCNISFIATRQDWFICKL